MSIQSLIIMGGVSLVAVLVGQRARERGVSPTRMAHQLVPALLIAVPIIYYVLILSQPPAAALDLLRDNPALHAGLAAMLLATLGVARRLNMRLLLWADICAPPLLLGLATTSLSFAVDSRLPTGLLLVTFWQIGIFWVLLQTERLLRARLRTGDTLLLGAGLAVPAAIGSMLVQTSALCAAPQLQACAGLIAGTPLFVISIGAASILILALRHAWPSTRAPLPEQIGPTL